MREQKALQIPSVYILLAAVALTHGLVQPCWAQDKVVPERLLFIANEAFGTPFRNPLGIFFDGLHDEILIADTGNHRVVILDGKDGFPKAAFQHLVRRKGAAQATPGEPRNLAVNSLGEIFVVDNLCDYVQVCDFRGAHLEEIRLQDYVQPVSQSTELDLKPVAVTVGPGDKLYIATSCWIFVFDKKLEFQKRLGQRGHGNSGFTAITDLWVDAEGNVFVTDARGLGLRVLSPQGDVLLAFGEHDAGFNNFSLPVGVITDRRGYIWVADVLRHIVPIFDPNGKFLDYIGAFGAGPGQFAFPSGIATDRDGRIVVLERVNARLQCFQLYQPSREGDAQVIN
jgi:DNA-binding beta-propeller fold protein YncE